MNRSNPLTVDRLEDRCVPAAIVHSFHIHMPKLDANVTATPLQPNAASAVPLYDFHFVIDAFLIDPNITPSKPLTFDFTLPIPDAFWQRFGATTPAPTPTPIPGPGTIPNPS